MPWSVPAPRLGRGWVTAPDPGTLRARWNALTAAEGPERDRLFRPSRLRSPGGGAAALPGQRDAATGRFAVSPGAFPEPVRVLVGPFHEQWLLPDQRLIDAARPELWRVRDPRQLFLVGGVRPQVTAYLPVGRTGPVRPLYRRPGGAEPNLAPGLTGLLADRYRTGVTAEDLLAWALAAGGPGPRGYEVPLPADPERWRAGLELGHRILTVQLGDARGGGRARLPGGRRPYVRAAVPARPESLAYDPETEELRLGPGVLSPVPAAAWEFAVDGVPVLERWFAERTGYRSEEGLEALGPVRWPQEWTSELLALCSALALLAGLEPERAALREEVAAGERVTAAVLREAGVLPVPRTARRPASVLDEAEEGPGGQFALL
ncbi:type ISP restriction/modification enzyme [Streptomyces sp. NPDC097619]|uniref:type ISP restriction/modification enzyme n=1 Tax=Streptomyces sp. NPDC097619 TaxID=3157228 RepID=UPI00332706D9